MEKTVPSSSSRVSFNEEEKLELRKAYESGLDSTRKEKIIEIEELGTN